MSRRRRTQPNTQAALAQTVATLATQVADLTRRLSPEQAARGTPLPPHIVNPPRVQRTPAIDQLAAKGDVNMGVPSQQMMNQMLANQAPQEGAVGIYAPGAPLQVVPGIESPYGPRIWDYPYGYNIAALPRSTERTSFQELRDLSDLYYGIRMCQRVIDDVLNRLELKIGWDDGVIPEGESETDAKWKKLTQPVYDFLSCPDGESSLSEWLIKSVRDVQELGQSIIYIARNKGKDIVRLDVVDAALIKPLLDQRGRLPQPPFPAFEQFIKGIPAGLYASDVRGAGTEDIRLTWKASQMHLIREMARTDSIYSRSRVEDVLLVINQALRKQNLDLTRYTDGSTPEGMVFVDGDTSTYDPAQVDEIERSLNGLLAGNDRLRARLKVMPPGLKDYQQTRSPDPQIDFDRWLLNITCGIFGVTMAEIGMTQDVNRSSGESQENVIYRRVVQPLANKYALFLTKIVKQQYDKRMRVSWGGIEEREDQLQKAQTYDIGVKNGSMATSTMARLMGWPVDKEVEPFVLFNGGPSAVVPTSAIADIAKEVAKTLQTQAQQAQAGLQNTKLQGQQLQMVIDQQKQQQQQGGNQGEEGGEGEGPEPPNGPGGGNGGAGEGNEEVPEEGEGEEAPEQESGETGNEQENEGGEPEQGGEDNEELPPDEQAQREVDRLIAEAKKRQSKGKQQRMQVADDADVSDEWRRYRGVALRAVKRQQSVPAFTSDVLPANLHAYAADALQRATTADDVRQVFSDVRAMEQAEAVQQPDEVRWTGIPIRGPNGRFMGSMAGPGSSNNKDWSDLAERTRAKMQRLLSTHGTKNLMAANERHNAWRNARAALHQAMVTHDQENTEESAQRLHEAAQAHENALDEWAKVDSAAQYEAARYYAGQIAGMHRNASLASGGKGHIVEVDADAEDKARHVFGHAVSTDAIASMMGARPGDVIRVSKVNDEEYQKRGYSLEITLESGTHHATYYAKRTPLGGLELAVDIVGVEKGERSASSGRDILRSLQAMREGGVNKLVAVAAGHPGHRSFNGYYTWARMGAIGDIPASRLSAVQEKFGKGVTRIEQLMALPGGAKWWKDHGDEWNMTINFSKNSHSMKVLDRMSQALGES